MFESIFKYILKLLGRDKNTVSDKEQQDNQRYNEEYTDISGINITSIFANKLANMVMSDSTVTISEKNARGKTLSVVAMRLEKKLKKIVAAAFGVGGCAIVPYVKNGNMYFDIVKQNRILINNIEGDRISQATILADTATIDNSVYYRFVDYNVSGGTLYMQNKVTNSSGSPAHVEKWANIPDMAITNVDRVLFGFIKTKEVSRWYKIL